MKLYDYQEKGVKFLLAEGRRYLADGMGLGKTPQACAAVRRLNETAGSRNTLVVCPASAIANWEREWEKWGPDQGFAERTIVSFADRHLHDRTLLLVPWDTVIVDEAHYAKTHTALRTKAAMAVAQQSPRSWLLSGTPMPNHPGELYAPIAALWPEFPRSLGLNNHTEWFNHFCKWYPTRYGRKVYGVKNAHQIREWQVGAMLRRQLDDVSIELPPLRVHVHRLHIPSTIVQGITGEETAKQRRLLGSFKAPYIAKLIAEELEAGAYPKIVIGAYHHDTLARLNEDLAKYNPIGFDGTTPVKKRQPILDTFTERKDRRVLIVQQSAAGVALNMQAAPEIALCEPDWGPDPNVQFIKRIHRIGQEHPCRARLFAVPGTLDDAVMSTLARTIAIQVKVGLK